MKTNNFNNFKRDKIFINAVLYNITIFIITVIRITITLTIIGLTTIRTIFNNSISTIIDTKLNFLKK